MKNSELIGLGADELASKINILEKELFKMKFQHSIRQIENTSKISMIKKDIARVNTAFSMKQNNL